MGAFPHGFVQRVKERFPENADGLHEHLLSGDPTEALAALNERLESVQGGIDPQDVVTSIEDDQVLALLASARQMIDDRELLAEARAYAKKVPHPWRD